MIDLVCVDVDGTLVGSSGMVPPEVWDAAERVRATGRRLAVCTGRPGFGLARGYAERLQPGGWHVFQNGASVVHLPSAESHSRPLADAAVGRLIATARATGRVLELYADHDYAVESRDARARDHAALLGVPYTPRALDSLPGPVVRAQWLVSHDDAPAVAAEPQDDLTVATSLSPVMPATVFVNMTPRGVDKSVAVRAVAAAYGVPMANVMMVGDGANDAAAMRAVGVPVAMGNAEPEALAAARHTVAHVDRLGLVEAFELALGL